MLESVKTSGRSEEGELLADVVWEKASLCILCCFCQVPEARSSTLSWRWAFTNLRARPGAMVFHEFVVCQEMRSGFVSQAAMVKTCQAAH